MKCEKYIFSFIKAFFNEIPDTIVQTIMNAKSNGAFTSSATTAIREGCGKCGSDIFLTYNIYITFRS